MEEKLIQEVKKYHSIYTKNSLNHRSRKYRAMAWKSISQAVGAPESICQTRWRTLRDRYVREYVKRHHMSGYVAESPEWEMYPHLDFLKDQVKPLGIRNSLYRHKTEVKPTKISEENYTSEHGSSDSLTVDHEFINTGPSITNSDDYFEQEIRHPFESWEQLKESKPVRAQKREKCERTVQYEAIPKLVADVARIAEKCCHPAPLDNRYTEHEGFFLMISDYLARLPANVVEDEKVFIINHLHSKIKNNQ